jgi:hypothetical protein
MKGEIDLIKTYARQIDLEFGTGDIGFNSGHYLEGGRKIGVIGFYNQEPRPIGAVADKKAGQEYSVGDFPIIMTFYKKESIDVVIQALLDAKKEME